jgi:hypothetical protein
LVLMRRGLGPTGVIDLRPEKTLVWPEGVHSMVASVRSFRQFRVR